MASQLSINEILTKKSSTQQHYNGYQPLFFRLADRAQKQQLFDLLTEKPYITVYDTIQSQLGELVKSFQPSETLTDKEQHEAVERHLNGIDPHDYGVWVYYPWSEKLVHIVDEAEFIALRTNRNRYKITDEERLKLSEKRIGVIGLSVGQSVSLTLAMERTFGELRIADFDELEITNLNRLRSGIHNMGLKKTVLVAREIAEIDPFLKVTCFHEGITDTNMEAFLLEGGKLNVLIDECDGVDVKINCRIAAKKHRIPVLMEASDRATIDVERFDLEPDRPILHGYVEHLDLSNVKDAKTMEEKLPYILPIVGVETMSTRLKASAIEIGQTISTWPQLASAVTMGGGMTADICRRVLLDQYHQSGRYFIDIEELVGDPKEEEPVFRYTKRSLNEQQMAAEAAKVEPLYHQNSVTDADTLKTLVAAAAIAPSAGNNQPWKWYSDGKQIYLFHDIERSESYGDFENMVSYVTFGTAIENLKLKAAGLGLKVTEKLFPLEGQPLLIAVFSFEKAAVRKDDLVNYITIRFTNRHLGQGGQIEADQLAEMRSVASEVPGAALKIIEGKQNMEALADITGQAEKLRLFIPQGHYELFEKEMRWSKEEVETAKDGLDIRTLELSPKDAIGFRVARDLRAVQMVASWNKGKALENMTAKLVATSAAAALITMPAFDPVNCIRAGVALERVWLTANKHAISLQPIMAAILHFARLNYGNGIDMPANIQQEFRKLNKDFNKLFKLDGQQEEPLFLVRLFTGEQPSSKSLRLDLDKVYFTSKK
ncbi:Rv1355c family protein [Pedobacter sp. BS3]|uniref:Rv1355c family protein n=1 Tax=Pedobacter sp. BS3 TaxID=2567937 RepID=UPI0011ED4BED|nr:Rv1355c family protein [Pedobacter sp. BS3]TZF82580.1 Rv1355c family protein [Pedobacter sp. BS3]